MLSFQCVFGICFPTILCCHNPSNRQVGTWRCRWIPISIQISTCKTLFFFAVAVGLLLEGRVALLNLPPLNAAILVKLVQSQQRVKGYWIWIQSQSTASSVWAQADVKCLLEYAHRIVRPTCLDGAPWSQNKEIVSNHYSILSLEGICSHKFHSEMSPSVNFGNFVASSSWQRFSHKLAGVWNWAQHMTLERSSVHLAGMLSPPGQSLEQFLHRTHFLPSGTRPISNVARRVGSVIQLVRRAVPQLIPEGLGTICHVAVARNVEHPFLRPPTMYNPVVCATEYALQSERDCIAQRLDVAETLQELADSFFEENLHALRLVDSFLLPVVAR